MRNFLAPFFVLNAFFFIQSANAQTPVDTLPIIAYEKPKEYEIGGVKVTGAKFSDENTLIGVSGLKVGGKIKFPGTDIPRAIKALWKIHLFTDVQIIKTKQVGDALFFEIAVKERPTLSTYTYNGVKKGDHDDLNHIVNRFLLKGSIITESGLTVASRGIEKHYKDKGFLDAKVSVQEISDPKRVNAEKLIFDVNKGGKVHIKSIAFTGNAHFTDKKLRKQMDKTHQKNKLFASSKLVRDDYDDDKKKIVKFYNNKGYRDAAILGDSIWRNEKGQLMVNMKVDEGKRYYFRNITWKGNSIRDTSTLSQVLGINKGDVYNTELLENRLKFSQDGRDVSSLYMDYGYLFFNIEPTEIAIVGDSVDLEMRIYEGPQATIDKVTIKGNDRTHDHVIRRELRTLPGDKFSRAEIIRSQREIINLGYFNQEALGINTPVNPQRGTVDIEYKVEEKPSDQLELSAGFGGYGVVGTLGVSFNNFSTRNLFNKKAWSPLPQGDGQRLSIRAQSNGKYFQSYTASFTEPWLGGKKPNSLTTSLAYTKYSQGVTGLLSDNYIGILQGSVSLGTRLKWPDDNFISTTAFEYQNISVNNYPGFFAGISQGDFNSVSISQTFLRSSISEPTFPKSGSKISLTLQASPPYSYLNNLFGNKVNYADLTVQDKFRWVEFYKWRFGAEWYTQIAGKLVLKTSAKLGSLGYYNPAVGYSIFGRYVLGGDGLANRQIGLTGKELLSLRGYETTDLPANNDAQGNQTGGTTFAKYSTELRYPVSLNPSSTIYVLAFADGGNVWDSFSKFRPFDLRRSAGIGLRVFLPMFGTLGFDYGIGFDKPDKYPSTKLGDYARFSIILGFEPE